MDENLARLNRIYPNSKYALVQKYNPETWKDREYDSKFDNKSPLNRWNTKPLSYEDAQQKIEEGFRIGWVVPNGMVVVDVDNTDHTESADRIIKILDKFEVKYSYNKTSRGMHFVFQDVASNIKTEAHSKCGLNIDIDTRANNSGYIILPCNDPHREWGRWNDFVEEIPYFLKPCIKDNTPSFIDMSDGDGRNDALFRWRSKLEQTHKFKDKEVENTIRTINEYLFAVAIPNNELFKTVLREQNTNKNDNTEEQDNKYNRIAEQIIERFDLMSFGDQFYKFNGTYYKPITNVEVEKIIHFDISKNISKTGRKEIVEFLRLKTQVSGDELDKDWNKIACKNGVLDLVTGMITTPTKTDYNTIFIPCTYNPNPTYSPRIDQFMKDICDGDMIKMNFLYQIAGYCLLKTSRMAKFFIFQGDGGTGKSTYMNIVERMIGATNTSHVGLADFDKDYYLATTISKLVNIDDDVVDGKALENTGRFKSLTAGECISVRQIYQPVVKFNPYVTCIFSCNKLPRIVDKTSGMYRRLILVELNHKVERPDPMFLSKITDADMEYFLYKAVEGVQQVLEEGRFRINLSEQEMLRKFRCRQSALNEWLYDNDMVLGDFHNKSTIAMFNIFSQWCDDNGYKKPNAYTFKEDICTLFDMDIRYFENDGQRQRVFYKDGNVNLQTKPF